MMYLTSSLVLEVIVTYFYDFFRHLFLFAEFDLEVFKGLIQQVLLVDVQFLAYSNCCLC